MVDILFLMSLFSQKLFLEEAVVTENVGQK